jgi:ppGpp synthetase/RelA/SpoT-type nucleotidyltranferase
MAKEVSKTQIDRLGDRLKSGNITEDDLRLLDQYRRSFADAYDTVVGVIRDKLGLEPTGRPAKSTTSIADKLKRESIRLTQIQDIAGCRIIVSDIAEQETVIQSITSFFQQATVIDRREKPSHGYRAVHVVVNCKGKLIEIQIRTSLQHAWAEMSEKLSDVIDPSVKYGGGPEELREPLQSLSEIISNGESREKKLVDALAKVPANIQIPGDTQQKVDKAQEKLKQHRQLLYDELKAIIDDI